MQGQEKCAVKKSPKIAPKLIGSLHIVHWLVVVTPLWAPHTRQCLLQTTADAESQIGRFDYFFLQNVNFVHVRRT